MSKNNNNNQSRPTPSPAAPALKPAEVNVNISVQDLTGDQVSAMVDKAREDELEELQNREVPAFLHAELRDAALDFVEEDKKRERYYGALIKIKSRLDSMRNINTETQVILKIVKDALDDSLHGDN